MARHSLRVSEIFHSLQGESRTSGLPTVFVRLTGCPLRCHYCDTQYAFTGGEAMTTAAILEAVSAHECQHVTLTGGEPLAQAGAYELLRLLAEAGFNVSLETSGAMEIAGIDPRVSIVMDLKTPGSGELEKNRWDNLAQLGPKDQLKFVICDRADYDWAKAQLQQWRLADIGCELLFSPVHGQLDPRQLAQWILADRLPVRLQLQLHKYLWGNERGR